MKPQTRYKPGDKIGRRYLLHDVKMGGMGEVYLCLDLGRMLPLALKTFQLSALSTSLWERFFEEVATWVAMEKHPNNPSCDL